MIEKKMTQYFLNQTKSAMICTGLAILTTCSSYAFEQTTSNNLFLHRAFSANISREMMMEGQVIKTDFDGFYSFFAMDGAYQRSWNQNASTGIGAFPFWSGTNSMTVGTNSSLSNLDAYQFGLGQVTTNGQIDLNPIVYQGGVDFLLYLGCSTNNPGMFFKIKAPLGMIGINPQLTEPIQATAAPYVAGAIAAVNNATYQPATTMTQAFAGSNYPNGELLNQGDFTVMQYGLIDGLQTSGVRFADVELTLGYNFICDEDHLLGFGFRASGPSGNKPACQYLLEPIFGRGTSWGVGAYIAGGTKLWQNHENKYLSVKVMGTVLHLVTSNTIRSYDLAVNGKGSKYMLVADYLDNSYQKSIQNFINVSTLNSRSAFSAEGDAAIALAYVSNGWEIDLGYEFWGRTAETLTITDDLPTTRYAVLGRQSVGAYNAAGPTTASTLCEPAATINISQNAVALDGATGATTTIVDATIPGNRIAGNIALDIEGAQQASASTSKIFSKAVYSWLDSHVSPYIGLMGEFEISTSGNNALPQWSLALVGGLYF